MDLFVRDECERLVKNQASKKKYYNLQLAREKLARRVTPERPRVKHMTKSKKVMLGCKIRECFARNAISRGTRETFCLPKR